MTDEAQRARWSLAIAALTMAIQNGIVMAFAVLYLPLIQEFGGSRADVAVVQSAVLLLGGFSGPAIGYALDRLGPRRLFQGGALLAALGLVLASGAAGLPFLLLTYGLMAGLGLAALGSQPNMVVAALWYPGARGRAIAVADLGTGFGAFLFIPLAQMLVARYGWRATLVVWAALLVALLIPANAFQRLPSFPVAAHGTMRPAGGQASGSPSQDRVEWTISSAARARAFWWLVAVRFFSAVAFPLMNVHLVAFAVGAGISPGRGAAALGTVSLVSLGGRLLTGWLADWLGRAPTLTLTYASAVVGIGHLALLTSTGWPGWLIGYVLFYGLAQGSGGIVTAARVADIFAGVSFGTIYGWIVLATGPGEGLGAWAGGAIFDLTGSYLWAFGLVVLVLLAGIGAIWQVSPPPQAGGPPARRST
ncbi:MAG: MFS transporter [Candidatus Rokubacteria bacterium]|nr:MFS transporter [Candidatus Rokubacteria bacterium]